LRETVERMLTSLREYLAKLSRKTKIQLSILAGVVITLAVVATVLLTRTTWVVLPGTGDPVSTSHIHSALVEMNEQVRVVGRVLEVPQQNLGRIEMMLMDQGYLVQTGFDMDIMSGAAGFGVTESYARQLHEAQRGEWIRTQIIQSPRIQNALVIVNQGETSPFRLQTNLRRPTAAVQLTLVGGGMLTQAEAQTIAEIVRGGVPGIEFEDIHITDSDLNHYPVGTQVVNPEIEFIERIALENQLTAQFQTQIHQLLSPIFGMSNLQVQPYVRLNFDRMVTEQVEFAPPVPGELGGIVRSSEIVRERSRRWGPAEGVPGTDSNAMGSIEYPWGEFDDQDMWMRHVETMNYEINETRRVIEHEYGVIRDLGISVVINRDLEGREGEEYDFSTEVADLITMAIGVPLANVRVQLLPFFVDPEIAAAQERMEELAAAQRTRDMVEMIIMYAVIVLLGVMVFLLGRTIVKALNPEPEPEPMLAAAGMDGIDYLISDETEAAVEYEDVDLTAKSAGLEQVERFIDKDAASVAQLLRNWLSDEA